jgi:hypothetical protein
VEEAWQRLETWQNNFSAGMTAEKYFSVCEQTGEEPDPQRIPPEVTDFPSDVQKAMILFNKLGDRVYPDIGYLGKDYTQLPIYMDVYEVEDRRLFLETLLRLDSKLIEKSAAQLKAERDKMKRH